MKAAIYFFLLFTLLIQYVCSEKVLNCIEDDDEETEEFDINPELKINDCDPSKETCTLKYNETFTLSFQFKPVRDDDSIELEASLINENEKIGKKQVRVTPSDCDGLTEGKCPVKKGQEYKYEAEAFLPDLSVAGDVPPESQVEVLIVGEGVDRLFCAVTNVKVEP